MINKEEWLPVEGYEGLYEVSNFGSVRSLNYLHTGQVKLLKLNEGANGYFGVFLYKNKKCKRFLVHRLVAQAFIPNWFDDPQVNHRDENKHNNSVDNLEWCDGKYNINYGTCIKRMVEKQSKNVLQLTKTGELVYEWPSINEAGRNGFEPSNIVNCCRGKLKSHGGYIWKYK